MLERGHNQFDKHEVWQKDRDHFLHPWTHFDSFKEHGSLVIANGEGCHVTDADGRRFLDGIAGMWCVNVGYGRDELAETMAQQARLLAYSNTFVDVTNAPAALLAGKLAELAPGSLSHVNFATSGSCANDSAIKLAHYYQARRGEKSRKHIISRHNSYHGSSFLTSSVGNRDGDRVDEFYYLTDFIHHLSAPYPYRRPDGMSVAEFTDFLVEEFRQKIEELGAENIACFIAEPIQGSGGVVVPPAGYLKRMYDLAHENGILFIADEVVSAFGRLGHWFISEAEFGIVPDIITVAKGITSGYFPLSAAIYTDEIHQVISSGGEHSWYTHGFTWSGHPIGCAVALKNIEIIERDGLLENAAKVGDHFEARLKALGELPLVGEVRGKRLMMCLEYVADKESRELFPDDINISKIISDLCEERGLLVRPIGHLDVMSPPLTLTMDEADFMVDTVADSIKAAADQLARDKAPPSGGRTGHLLKP